MHLGHRAVIAEAVKQARAQNGKGAVFTFEPPHHTDRTVSKSDVKLLQSPESRDRVMEELGVELVLCPPFESFYNFSPEEFVREILKNCLNCRVWCAARITALAKRAPEMWPAAGAGGADGHCCDGAGAGDLERGDGELQPDTALPAGRGH